MPQRSRKRERIFWPGCHSPHHHWDSYGPCMPPGWVERPTHEEETSALKEHIEMLKEEIAEAEKHLKEMEDK